MRQVYKVDSNGYYIAPVIIKKSDETPSGCVDIKPPNGLFKARFAEGAWVSGLSSAEIESLRSQTPKSELELLRETVDQLVLDNLMRGF